MTLIKKIRYFNQEGDNSERKILTNTLGELKKYSEEQDKVLKRMPKLNYTFPKEIK